MCCFVVALFRCATTACCLCSTRNTVIFRRLLTLRLQAPPCHQHLQTHPDHSRTLPVGWICSARATTLPSRLLLLLLLQNSSQEVHRPRSVLNLRTERSKMKWMRRTMAKSARLFFFLPEGHRKTNRLLSGLLSFLLLRRLWLPLLLLLSQV